MPRFYLGFILCLSLASRVQAQDAPVHDLRLVSVGDVIPHRDLQRYALSQKTKFNALFDRLGDSISKADLAIANFEAAIDPEKPISGYPRFNAHPGLMKALKKIGFGLLSLANNHSLDLGEAGLLGTLNSARKFKLKANGISTGAAGLFQPSFMRVNGIKIAFLSLTTLSNRPGSAKGDPALRAALPQVFLLNYQTAKQIRRSIRRMARRSDIAVVAVHFGKEYLDQPTGRQRRWARLLANWGADIILGNHSHHIQRPAWLDSPGGRRTLVSFSQGNFISHQNRFANPADVDHESAKRGDSFLLNIDIRKTGSATKIVNVSYTPTWMLCFPRGKGFGFKSVVLAAEINNPLDKAQVPLLVHRRQRIVELMKGFRLEE